MDAALHRFRRTKTILLTTYKRDGRAVATPVSIAFDGERAFFRTWDTAWKAKRLRRDPNVEIAPSTWRGTSIGPPLRARAHRLAGAEAERARQALARSQPILHGIVVPMAHRLMRWTTIHFELTPIA